MESLNALYVRMLHLGMIVLRQAFESKDDRWLNAEIELLHNIPSLLDEVNVKRHQYFWFKERETYIAWSAAAGSEQQRSRMRMYYEPIWRDMQPIILAIDEETMAPGVPSVAG
jgi:hypothetical protein